MKPMRASAHKKHFTEMFSLKETGQARGWKEH